MVSNKHQGRLFFFFITHRCTTKHASYNYVLESTKTKTIEFWCTCIHYLFPFLHTKEENKSNIDQRNKNMIYNLRKSQRNRRVRVFLNCRLASA